MTAESAGAVRDIAPAETRAGWAGRLWRLPLAAKLAFAFIGLVAFVLLVNGAVEAWLGYNQAKRAALEVQSEKARSAAARVGEFLSGIETELGWTTGVEWKRLGLDQQRYDFIRLLRQAPAITALSYIDGQGKEQLAVSRLEPDSIASGKDFSGDPRFVRAVADKIWFGPVEFRRGSEPYMTFALAHVGKNGGVTVADVNLKLIWDVISAIHVGDKGHAYVVDDRGRLIADPDLSLVLRDTDLSGLPQVKVALAELRADETAASATTAPRVGSAEIAKGLAGGDVLTAYSIALKPRWIVFVQQPLAEAFASVAQSLLRTLALLGLGLALALVSGVALARRMAAPIRLLQAGAERLGAGDYSQRIEASTGDEIEALAGSFNTMAGRLKESYETLEAKVEARTRDLEEALKQQTATANVLKVISRSAFDLHTVLKTLTESARSLSGAAIATVLLRDGEVLRIRAESGCPPEFLEYIAAHPPRLGRETGTGRVLMTGDTVHIPDVFADPDYDYGAGPQLGGYRAQLGVPLIRDGKVEGVFGLMRPEPGAFTPRQIELVRTFADQAVIAIENVRLFEEVQAKTRDLEEALAQQTATADVLKIISRSAFDLDAVLKTLTDSARSLSGAALAVVFMNDGEMMRIRAESGFSPALIEYARAHPIRAGRETFTGRAALSGEVVHIPDVLADPDYDYGEAPRLFDYRAGIGVPLLRAGRVDGVFGLMRPEPGAFTPRQIEMARAFADQAVIAIENARLFNEVRAKTRDLEESLQQQTATADVLKVISRSAFDLQAVLQTLVESAAKLCDANMALITREVDGVLYRAESYGCSAEFMAEIRHLPILPDRGTVSGRVLLEGKAVQIEDVGADPEYAFKTLSQIDEFHTCLGIPMLRNGVPIGVISLLRSKIRAFDDKQIELVQTFADQAVIAIENARLFNEVQAKTRDLEEALTQQTATADVLKVISRSAFDLQAVLDTLVSSAVRLCGAAGGLIFLQSGDTFQVKAATAEVESRDAELLRRLRATPQRPGRGTVGARVLLTGEVQNIADVQLDSDYDPDLRSIIAARALLGVPLKRGDAVIGAVALRRAEPGAFSQRQIELVQTFADQAVIAIENTRLFDEVQAKTRDLEEALGQQTATANVLKVISRSAFDLQAVLTTLAESARELCGASFVTLNLREGEVMRLRAESGCTPETVAFLHAHPIRAGRQTYTGRVMLSGEPVHLSDVLADPEYSFGEGPSIGNYRALLCVPLLREGRVEGVFALARPEPVAFTDRQIEIVRAFADQAVIAIQNARLFGEVQARTNELTSSLQNLRNAQDRLIQSEKLASLGQLTAGIAHEIKNPLNFVNNFSGLSREILDELKDVLAKAPLDPATRHEADDLVATVAANLDKVVQHGRRADSIVKNMLLHSREGSGERTETNVNAMVEEALNLAYHGARAEKPGFNVTIVRELDPDAGKADLYPQEITRVLLNLISNGFYATTKRRQAGSEPGYEPTLTASTRNLGDRVEIAIKDNGTGIPDNVKEKMFNPFFTTKPAGEGTGLGLSLSHDIVVKQHGGAIDVESAPGSTKFVIRLPRADLGADLKPGGIH